MSDPKTTKGNSREPDSASTTPQAEVANPELIKQQTALYAHVLSAQRYVEAVSRTCGQNARRLAIAWNARNARALELASELRGKVQEQIEATAGSWAATALEDRQDEYLDKKASQSIQAINALSNERKQHFCRAFGDSVENGRYDVVMPEPKELDQIPLQEAAVTIDIYASSKGLKYDLSYKDAALRDIEHVLFLPRGETIRLSVHSTDVIHSLVFTEDQIKPMVAVPKLKNERNIVFEKLGGVGIGCLERHPGSDEELIAIDVVEQDEFDTWLRTIDALQPK